MIILGCGTLEGMAASSRAFPKNTLRIHSLSLFRGLFSLLFWFRVFFRRQFGFILKYIKAPNQNTPEIEIANFRPKCKIIWMFVSMSGFSPLLRTVEL